MHFLRRSGFELAFLLAAPVAAVLLFDIPLIVQDRDIDPWLYTGYGQSFALMQTLYGWTYYAVRFPVMMLNGAFPGSMGPVVGYVVLRYLLVLMCGVPLYFWARRYFGVAIAAASYLFLLCNPIFPHIIQWDYTTFVSVPLALAGICVWLLPTKRLWLNRGVAGFLFCASAASHAFTGTAIGTFVIIEGFSRLWNREFGKLIWCDVLATGVGALLCFIVGVLYYYWEIGPFDPSVIISTTVMAVKAGNQYALSHTNTSLAWLETKYHVYVPYLLILASGLALGRRCISAEVSARVWRFAAIYAFAYTIYEFAFKRFIIESSVYWAHLTVVIYLLFPVCLALLSRAASGRGRTWVGTAAIVALLAVPLINRFVPSLIDVAQAATVNSLAGAIGVTILLIGCAVLVWASPKRIAIAATASAFLVAVIQVISFVEPEYRFFARVDEARELGVYRAAVEMFRVFSTYSRPDARVMLWFPVKEYSIGSIASTALLFSLNDPWQGIGMPTFGDHERERLRYPGLRYIMLLSYKSETIAAGRKKLSQEGIKVREITSRIIGQPGFYANLDLVEIMHQ